MPARFVTPTRHPTDNPFELSKQLDEIAQGVQQLASQQSYIQATEPQIANAKIVLWRDTVNSKSFLVIRFLGVQYKIELAPSVISTGSPQAEFSFRWPHIVSTNMDFIPGGTDLGVGADVTVRSIEGYFEVAPVPNATINVMNGTGDGAPVGVTFSTNRFFQTMTKAVTSANRLFVRLSGAPNAAEFLAWARVTFTIP